MTWARKNLEEVADFLLGKMLDEKKNKGTPMSYLANVNVRWGSFELENVRQMRFEPHELERYGLQFGDIVMCEGGEPGRCAIWKNQVSPMMFQKALHRIRPVADLDYRFLYYSFLNRGNNGGFDQYCTGSTIKHLPRQNLAKVEVEVPPLKIQKQIASVLSAYDDLIENNTRRIEILEEMVRRLYEEWFVNCRFPGHEGVEFKESELGLIPAGWDVVTLEKAVEINPKTKVEREGDKIFVAMAALSESSMVISGCDVKSGNSGAKFQNGDTLVARISPCLENGKTGFVDFLPIDQPAACGSTEFIVLRSRLFCPEMVYSLARSERFRNIAMKSMSGATGRQRVRVESLCSLLVVQPDSELIERYRQFAQPCFKEVRVLANKNANLRVQRDLLLPKLISGEIDVSDIPMPN